MTRRRKRKTSNMTGITRLRFLLLPQIWKIPNREANARTCKVAHSSRDKVINYSVYDRYMSSGRPQSRDLPKQLFENERL